MDKSKKELLTPEQIEFIRVYPDSYLAACYRLRMAWNRLMHVGFYKPIIYPLMDKISQWFD